MRVDVATIVTLTVTPARALTDQPVVIQVTGLPPGEPVTLAAEMVDDFGRSWHSSTELEADDNGIVNTATMAPLRGSYAGVDPMGLFWSMVPSDGRMVGPSTKDGLLPTRVSLSVSAGEDVLAATKIERLFVADGVERVSVRERGLVGTLFLPPGEGPLPAMLTVTGSGGGIDEGRAAMLASHGYAAFALAYFNATGLPDSLIDIPLEYLETGISWLAEHPRVRSDRLGVIGGSRGGELSLLLGSMFPAITAVVAYVPSAVVWGGFGRGSDELPEPPASWTYRGVPLAYMPPFTGDVDLGIAEGDPIPLTPYFLKSMESAADMAATAIAVERIAGPVLLISGEADAMWPSAEFARAAFDRLERAGHPHPNTHLAYADAGHMIRTPYVPTTVTDSVHPVSEDLFAMGGTAEGNAHANEDSWRHVVAFLAEHPAG
jgi:dienelactone hydrolase